MATLRITFVRKASARDGTPGVEAISSVLGFNDLTVNDTFTADEDQVLSPADATHAILDVIGTGAALVTWKSTALDEDDRAEDDAPSLYLAQGGRETVALSHVTAFAVIESSYS